MTEKIDWLPWGEEAFKVAAELDRPIFLAISAVWCHWCHVMDKSTYTDEGVIKIISDQYVPIRVDNDKRPDINSRYNMGGWPTVAILSPKGQIITGTTYEPPESLTKLLSDVTNFYLSNKDKLDEFKKETPKNKVETDGKLPEHAIEDFIEMAKRDFDFTNGGFGLQPKFPFIDTLSFLLEMGHTRGDDELINIVVTSLKKMAAGDVFDQVGGGFFRYATRSDWSQPHYEKMLEDNSKLLKLYLETYQVLGDAFFLSVALHIHDYVSTTLRGDSGFFGSQDADEDYYQADPKTRADLVAPYIDKTIYVDWNASCVSSFLLYSVLAESKEAGAIALDVLDGLYDKGFTENLGLRHHLETEEQPVTGLLEDHAMMIDAHIDAYEATGDEKYVKRAKSLAAFVKESLWDDENRAFIDRPPTTTAGFIDEPVISIVENSQAAISLIRLSRLSGDADLIDMARVCLSSFKNSYKEYGIIAASYGQALSLLNKPAIDISFIGDKTLTAPLIKEARINYIPGKLLRMDELARKKIESKTPGAYICIDGRCLKPAGTTRELTETFKEIE